MYIMRAMVLEQQNAPLVERKIPQPRPAAGEVLVKVHCCGICRTDLHVVDGDLKQPKLPLIPGHQIVGSIAATGSDVTVLSVGQRVGIPWLGWSCGNCVFCQSQQENLCDDARYTGYQFDGGFAEYCCADGRYCFPISDDYPDQQAAPLLCAGLIGYRSYRMALESAGQVQHLGLYGFGAAAHILIQVALHDQRQVYAFTRDGDTAAQAFARELGAEWAGASSASPPQELDAAIIFAPVGELVPAALKQLRKGGAVICAGIHMSDIPQFPYSDLWQERSIHSVANLTRADGEDFLKLAPQIPVNTEVHTYPLSQANQALDDLRQGHFTGSAVLTID